MLDNSNYRYYFISLYDIINKKGGKKHMKGLMIFANGFEDVEGIATLDILRRAKIDITCAVATDNLQISTAHNVHIVFKTLLKNVHYQDYDFLIIPGGPAVFNTLDNISLVSEIIKDFCLKNKLVCAICAAPHLIGKLGFLNDVSYTCFPGCNKEIIGGNLVDKGVVPDKNFITARSMYYANDFALEIVLTLKGNEVAMELAKQIKGL